jgi:hypothetical protein
VPDSRQHDAHPTGRRPAAWLGFSETVVRAEASGRMTVCAQLATRPGAVKLTGIRLALGVCDHCSTIDQAGGPSTISGTDLVCQAVTR